MGNEIKQKENSDIDRLREQCKNIDCKAEISEMEKGINLYEKIFEIDNTKEDDIVKYMRLLLGLCNRKKIDKKLFENKMKVFTHGINDSNYAKYFFKFPRNNNKT